MELWLGSYVSYKTGSIDTFLLSKFQRNVFC